jgi:hypothetical protein
MPSTEPALVRALDILPSEVEVERYKCFQPPARLPLRPLTLIFGSNNGGKSALLRLLPLLADSAQGPQAPGLNPASKSIFGARFRDLLSQSITDDDPPDFSLTLSWPCDTLSSARYQFKAPDQGPTGQPTLESLTLSGADATTFQRLPSSNSYTHAPPPMGAGPVWSFNGLTPALGAYAKLPEALTEKLKALSARLTRLSSSVQWLHALRASGPRYRDAVSLRARLSPSGDNAVELLHASPALLPGVNAFFKRAFARELLIEQAAETGQLYAKLRLLLPPQALLEGDRRVEVHLCDCGEGFQQCLSVLVALEHARLTADLGPALIAIEEPESHLHPSAQRALVEHICDIVSGADHERARVVLETHSQQVLLGVQVAVATGRLSPDAVSILWVQQDSLGISDARSIHLDAQGLLSGAWPREVFGSVKDLSRALLEARRSP